MKLQQKTAQATGRRGRPGLRTGAFTLVELPVVSKRGFTLVELLVVVAIIALLVSILLPTLGKAKEGARKAICSANLSAHGKTMAMYVSEYRSYPLSAMRVGDGVDRYGINYDAALNLKWTDGTSNQGTSGFPLLCWPKFNAVLNYNKIGSPSRKPTTWGVYQYPMPMSKVGMGGKPLVNTIWSGALCPSMDGAGIFAYGVHAAEYGFNGNFLYWGSFHPWCMGYQWNPNLRGAQPGAIGRDPVKLLWTSSPAYVDRWKWGMGQVRLKDDRVYCAQAVTPEECHQPGNIVEATDSWDLTSVPGLDWWGGIPPIYGVGPGWYEGPNIHGLRVVVNGGRHKGPPPVLYADGHVASDASREIDPVTEMGDSYKGIRAYTWPNYDNNMFGNIDHRFPRLEFAE